MSIFEKAILIEELFPLKARTRVIYYTANILGVILIVLFLAYVFDFLPKVQKNFSGLAMITLSIYLVTHSFDLYSRSLKERLMPNECEKIFGQTSLASCALPWWTKESLSKVKGMAKDWSQRATPNLDLFVGNIEIESRDLPETERVICSLENNGKRFIVLVGDDLYKAKKIVGNLSYKFLKSTVPIAIQHRRIVWFDLARLINEAKDSDDARDLLEEIMAETIKDGAIILYIEDLPRLYYEAKARGIELFADISQLFTTKRVSLIFSANYGQFKQIIEKNEVFGSKLEAVYLLR